ncbi:hypothetical protein BH23ACT9_BH23ACT9_15870 [soil metagenome]
MIGRILLGALLLGTVVVVVLSVPDVARYLKMRKM